MRNSAKWGWTMFAKCIGFGYALPKRSVSNEELSTFVDTNDEWISSRTGIKSRFISEDENTSDLGTRAAIQAIKHARIAKEEIDLIICATFTPDYSTPSTACLIQAKLGLNDCEVMAFDLNAACSGFLYALRCADAYVTSGMATCVLVVGSEVISKQLDWHDRDTCVIFADGAGAAIVTNTGTSPSMYHYTRSSGDDNSIIYSDVAKPRPLFSNQVLHDHVVHMQGSATFRFAIKAMQESIVSVCEQAKIPLSHIDYVVPHQANIRIIQHVMKRLSLNEDQVFVNIDTIGNTSAASIPIALGQMSEQGKLQEDTTLVLSGFGAGFTWAGCLLKL